MYIGVPTVMPVWVSTEAPRTRSVALAIPKSVIFTRPSTVTMTFSGLRSRCTTLRSCACARPASVPSSTPPTWASVIERT